jgi:hypothetical protein
LLALNYWRIFVVDAKIGMTQCCWVTFSLVPLHIEGSTPLSESFTALSLNFFVMFSRGDDERITLRKSDKVLEIHTNACAIKESSNSESLNWQKRNENLARNAV